MLLRMALIDCLRFRLPLFERNADMIGFYNYTVWLTYLGMISGVSGLWFAATGKPLFAVLCLLFAGFCDLFDGKVARTKKDRSDEERRYGIEIDSLSDLICFGVLPAAIGFSIGLKNWYWIPLFCAYVLTALIRLGYYNVTEESRQKKTKEVRRFYQGLPVTSAAIIFPLAFIPVFFDVSFAAYIYAALIGLAALFFVTPIRVLKPRKAGIYVMLAIGAAIGLFFLATYVYRLFA